MQKKIILIGALCLLAAGLGLWNFHTDPDVVTHAPTIFTIKKLPTQTYPQAQASAPDIGSHVDYENFSGQVIASRTFKNAEGLAVTQTMLRTDSLGDLNFIKISSTKNTDESIQNEITAGDRVIATLNPGVSFEEFAAEMKTLNITPMSDTNGPVYIQINPEIIDAQETTIKKLQQARTVASTFSDGIIFQ